MSTFASAQALDDHCKRAVKAQMERNQAELDAEPDMKNSSRKENLSWEWTTEQMSFIVKERIHFMWRSGQQGKAANTT